MDKQVCRRCGAEKEIDMFYKNVGMSSGYETTCIACRKKESVDYREQTRDIKKAKYQLKKDQVKKTREKLIAEGHEVECRTCGEIKSLAYFFIDPSVNRGHKKDCTDCHGTKTRGHYDKIVRGNEEALKKGADRVSKYYHEVLKKDPVKMEKRNSRKRVGNMTPEQQQAKKKSEAKYRQTEAGKESKRKAHKKERATPRGKIRHAVSSSIRARLQKRIGLGTKNVKGGKSAFDKIAGEGILPYTVEELMEHLEKQFTDGMTWDNYGTKPNGDMGWHVDHILPDTSFDYNSYTDPEFLECWSLLNLQPMWGGDNLSKGSKLDYTVCAHTVPEGYTVPHRGAERDTNG